MTSLDGIAVLLNRRRVAAAVLCVAAFALGLAVRLYAAGTLVAVSPGGSSPGLVIQLTGTGFDATAANNSVEFRDAAGTTKAATPSRVTLLNAGQDLRRLTLTVPDSLAIGTASLTVVNATTGESIAGLSLEILTLSLPEVASAARGAERLKVRIQGSPNSQFVQNSRATFGGGITVHSTTVESATSAVAEISVAAGAALGPRTVGMSSTTQTAALAGGFTVLADPPPPPDNAPPSVTAGANQKVTLPATATLNGSATDDGNPVGGTLTYLWTQQSGPSGASFSAPTSASTQVTFPGAGTYVLRLAASDGEKSSFAEVTIAAVAVNAAPDVNAGADQEITLPATATLVGTASDDGLPATGTLTTVWGKRSGSGAISFSAAGALTTTATFAKAGTFVIRLTAKDGEKTSNDEVTIVVNPAPVNQPPQVEAGPDQEISISQSAALSGQATDDGLPPGGPLTATWKKASGPGKVTFANPAALVTTATFSKVGLYTLRLTVSDGAKNASDTLTVNVTADAPANAAPIVSAGEDLVVTRPQSASITGTVTDDDKPQGSTLAIAWSQQSGPGTATFTPPNAAGTSVAFSAPGTYVLRLTADDGDKTAFDEVSVRVDDPPNVAPVVNAGVDQEVTFPSSASLTGTVTDDNFPIGSSVTVTWSQVDGAGTASFQQANAAATSVTFSGAGTYLLRLTATDGDKSAFDEISITVKPPTPQNAAPFVNAGDDLSITLPATAKLAGVVTDDDRPTATVTISWRKIDGEGEVAFAPPNAASSTATFSQPGKYTLELRGDDGELSTVDTVVVTVAPPTASNTAPVVQAGDDQEVTLAAGAQLAATVTDDGQPGGPLQHSWQQISGPGQTTFGTPGNAATGASFTLPGLYVLALSVSDGELTTTDDIAVNVTTTAADGDRAPPVLSLIAPTEALPGATVELRAQAADDVGVTNVRFESTAFEPQDRPAAPYTLQFQVPELAEPGSTITVRAIARDASNNIAEANAEIRISVTPDTESPTVRAYGPTAAGASQQVFLVGVAQDNVGVAAVTFLVDGAEIATVSDLPYMVPFDVPAGVEPGTSLTVLVRARDAAGNVGEATAHIGIVALPNIDVTPPTIDLVAPAQVVAGAPLDLSAVATDLGGIASVAFKVGALQVAVVTEPPYTARYLVPPLTEPGSTLEVTAEATDLVGLTATATRPVTVLGSTNVTQAIVSGEVYDDATSLPLAGATVALVGTDAAGAAYALTTTSDARGRYILRTTAGEGVLRIGKQNYTRVDRPVTLVGGQAVEALDARLTQFGAAPQSVSAVLGATLGSDAQLLLPAGALAQNQALQVVGVGRQGLQGRLPLGWSPVGGADVAPHGVAFAGPATLRVPNAFELNDALAVVAAQWDEAAAAWRALGQARFGAGNTLEADVMATGQVVFVVADAEPLAPAVPAPGDIVAGVAAAALPVSLSTEINPQPQILFYKPGAVSDVRGRFSADAPLTSGQAFLARISEVYAFYSGSEARPEPFVEDLFFYQVSGPATSLSASAVVTPSLQFDPLALERGVITVELFARDTAPAPIQVIGATGGQVDGPQGSALLLPLGAVSDTSPIVLGALTAGDFGTLPEGLSLVQGVDVAIAGALARSGQLSVPRPADVSDAANLLLVTLQDIQGATRCVLAAVVRIDGDRLVSETTIAGQQTALPGVRATGRYAFVRAAAPLGFAGGLVRGVQAAPFAGALVVSNALGVVSLSDVAGAYVAAAPAGAVVLTATDLGKSDSGSASSFLTAGAMLPVTLRLLAQPPTVAAISPANGAHNVPLLDPIVVTFSEPIDPASVAGANLANIVLAGANGTALEGAAALSQNNTVLTFRPKNALEPNAPYTVTLGIGIKDASGYGLPAPFTAQFESLDTAPPPMPAAGALTASIPDAQGLATVSGTQGTAGPADRVFVDNLTRKTVAVALVEPNGSFSTVIAAGITDKLRVRIVDASGNETIADLGVFKTTNADGSVSQVVSADGGVVDGPGGTRAKVRPGTFPEGTVVTLKKIEAAEFPKALTPEQAEKFEFDGGVEIDFGGATPAKYVDVGVPMRGDETAENRWVLAEFTTDESGNPSYNAVDTGRIIDNRITTSSPPCPGVTAGGKYGFIKPKFDLIGINHARLYTDAGTLKADVFNVQAGPISLRLPWDLSIDPNRPPQYCFPALTSDVTITPNAVKLTIPGGSLTPSDRQFVVVNDSAHEEHTFPRHFPEFVFDVPGTVRDNYRILAAGHPLESGGDKTKLATFFEVTTLDPDRVRIRINPDPLKLHVTSITITNLSRVQDHEFPIASDDVTLIVTGGVRDTYLVRVFDADGTGRDVVANPPQPSAVGSGNLVIRAREGTIDPTRAEAGSADTLWRTRVVLRGAGFEIVIPEEAIVNGGFAMAFDGHIANHYELVIEYNNSFPHDILPWSRPPYIIELPRFRVVVRNPLKGTVVKTIEAFMPPPDEPQALGDISDDETRPYVIAGPTRLQSFDPAGTLTFTFSEEMDPDSLIGNIVVLNKDGNAIAGHVQVSGASRVATFVPDGGLKLGEEYTVTVTDRARDRAGNYVNAMTLKIKTFTPRVVSDVSLGVPFKDVAIVKKTVNERVTTTAFATTGLEANFVSIDVTDVRSPIVLNRDASSSPSRQKLIVLPDVEEFTTRDGKKVKGDIAISTVFNARSSFMTFHDVSAPATPVPLGIKVMTVDPALAQGESALTTVFATGLAKGVTALRTQSGIAAYAAVERVGVMSTDLANNIPTRLIDQRVKEGLYPGDHVDITTYQGTLLAVSERARTVDFLDANLGPVGVYPLAAIPYRVRTVEDLRYDANNDGFYDPAERYDLALVAASDGLHIVDISNVALPSALGFVPLPGRIREIDVDGERRRAFVSFDDPKLGSALGMIDISNPTQTSTVDGDGDGVDDRIIWRAAYPKGVNGLRFEAGRGLLYVSNPANLEIWAVYDICCDLGVDLEARPAPRTSGDLNLLLRLERRALSEGIGRGLDKAVAECGLSPANIRMFESGSSSCLWEGKPDEGKAVKACGGNYQPGVSDHDISVFFADSMFPEGGVASGVLCTLQKLSAEFVDENDQPVPITVEGRVIRFEDISFLPNRLSWWHTSTYGLDRTDPSIPGDSDNDLGLARQFLHLKHTSEARWVDVPGWESLKDSIDFEDALRKMRNATFAWVRDGVQRTEAMSPVEAFESANLMEFNLYKGMAWVRIKNAADERSAFNKFLVKQIHDIAKAGIRATLAKMIANPQARERLMAVTRNGPNLVEQLSIDKPLLTLSSNACLTMDPARAVAAWDQKPCGSLEEYIASAAARTRRWWGLQEPLEIFTDEEVKFIIPRFYRLKADLELVDSDAKADEFLATTINWVFRMLNDPEIRQAYDDALGSDPRAATRQGNMAYKAERIEDKKKHAKFDIVPHVFNRGFTDAPNIKVQMYTATADGPYAQSASTTVFLSGGTDQELRYKRKPDGEIERDEKNKPVGIFRIKDIDQTGPFGETHRVVFTIDLPDRSAKEAFRENNIGGFFWYLLDAAAYGDGEQSPQPPMTPDTPPPPFSGAELADLLEPDPECFEDPRLFIDQTITYQGTVQPNPAFILIDEDATYRLIVAKPGFGAVSDATACETMTGQCHSLGPVATGLPGTVALPVPTQKAGIYDIVPTVYSSSTGVQRGAALRVVISCERYSVVPVAPDSPSEASVIMQGGTSYRYFRVIDNLRKGPADPGTQVTLTMNGPMWAGASYTATFVTGPEGNVGLGSGEGFVPGVAFAYTKGAGGRHQATVEAESGGKNYCSSSSSYEIEFQPFSYTEALKAGAELSAGIGNPFKKAKFLPADAAFVAKGGGGLSLEFDTTLLDGTRADNAFEIGRFVNIGIEGTGSVGADIEKQKEEEEQQNRKSLRVKNRGFAKRIAADSVGADLGAGVEILSGDAHRFALPLTDDGKKGLLGLMMDTAVATSPMGPVGRKLLSVLQEKLFGITLPKVSEKTMVRVTFNADFQAAGVDLSFGKRDPESNEYKATGHVKSENLDASINLTAALEWERRFNDGKKEEDIAGLLTEGEFKWNVPFTTHLPGAKAAVDAGKGDSFTKAAKKKFLDELENFLQGVTAGEFGGGIEVRLHTDPEKGHEVTELEVIFLGPLAYANIDDPEPPPPPPPDDGGGQNGDDPPPDPDAGTTRTKSLRFRVESKDQVSKLLQNLTSISSLLESTKKAALGVALDSNFSVGPSVIYEFVVDFVKDVIDFARYDVPIVKARVTSYNLDLSLLAVLATKVVTEAGVEATFSQQVAYPLERGRVVGGVQYKLEDYSAAQPHLRDFVQELTDRLRPTVEELEPEVNDGDTQETEPPDPPEPGEPPPDPPKPDKIVVKDDTGDRVVVVEPTTDPVAVETTKVEIEQGPVKPKTRRPDDLTRRGDKPGFGVGRVVRVTTPKPQPVEVTIKHSDDEVPPASKDKLRPHTWNKETGSWQPVPGPAVVDPVARTVTATIPVDDDTIITLAPIEGIPVGPIDFPEIGMTVVRTGSGAQMKTTVRLLSLAIPMNDGNAMPPGSIVHVLTVLPDAIEDGLPVPVGRILSADALPAEDGHQIALDASGRADVQIEFDGDPLRIRLIAFTDEGVASVDRLIAIPRP